MKYCLINPLLRMINKILSRCLKHIILPVNNNNNNNNNNKLTKLNFLLLEPLKITV